MWSERVTAEEASQIIARARYQDSPDNPWHDAGAVDILRAAADMLERLLKERDGWDSTALGAQAEHARWQERAEKAEAGRQTAEALATFYRRLTEVTVGRRAEQASVVERCVQVAATCDLSEALEDFTPLSERDVEIAGTVSLAVADMIRAESRIGKEGGENG